MARDAKFLAAKLERLVAVDCHALEATFRGAIVADRAMPGAAIAYIATESLCHRKRQMKSGSSM
jgi:hypothetical protein